MTEPAVSKRVSSAKEYEFDLHGVVGIRLLSATADDADKVERQLGPLRAVLGRKPDITVRFVDAATTKPMTYAGLAEGGFNDDGFFVLRGKGGVPARAMIPFDRIGRHPEIICERAMPVVPHLLAVINLTALSKGVLPLHASAFTVNSTGVLVTGWAKGGKTESLLAGMAAGARYVGDEWIYLTADGSMLGLPEPIRLWAWHLQQMSALLKERPLRDQMRLSAWHWAAKLTDNASGTSLPGTGLFRRAAPIISRQAYLQVPPAELFGRDAMTLRGNVDAVVLVVNHESPQILVQDVGPSEISARMAASLVEERGAFLAHYHQFRYSFPWRGSAVIDTAEALERPLLEARLDNRPGAKILHPYPCDIPALGRAVASAADPSRGG